MAERTETVVVDPGSEAPEVEAVSGNSPKNNNAVPVGRPDRDRQVVDREIGSQQIPVPTWEASTWKSPC